MKSPFPGMDPFIEARHLWGDFHDEFVIGLKRVIMAQLPTRYVARTSDRTFMQTEDPDVELTLKTRIRPDIEIATRPSRHPAPTSLHSPSIVADPPALEMRGQVEYEEREIYLDILKLDPVRQLVTSIELLSPANKRRGTAGWDQYERKRGVFVHGHAHLVEIDLLRRGRRHPMTEAWPESPFVIAVFRSEKAPAAEIWPSFMLQPLPTIPIPLLPPDGDLAIALQPIVADIYERSRYFDDMQYDEPLQPPLPPAEAKHLAEFLASHRQE